MEVYLISTSHLENQLWFRDEEDFKAGMNHVAVTAYQEKIQVLAFILMSNHVHFAVQCSYPEAERFITLFKKRYSMYFRRKYGIAGFLRRNDVDIRLVRMDGESFERVVAYIVMNSVAANICLHASQYPWGTGGILFNLQQARGKELKYYSRREQSMLLHSWVKLPESYRMAEEGYILPESYVPVTFLESVFRTPKRLSWFLANSSKAKILLGQTEAQLPSFRDQSLVAAIQDLCISLFRKNTFKELSKEQKAILLQQLRRRFSADPAQIARVTGITYEETVDLLE